MTYSNQHLESGLVLAESFQVFALSFLVGWRKKECLLRQHEQLATVFILFWVRRGPFLEPICTDMEGQTDWQVQRQRQVRPRMRAALGEQLTRPGWRVSDSEKVRLHRIFEVRGRWWQ